MNSKALVVLLMLLGGGIARADLKPDIIECDAKKAARNAAMDAAVGVSGRCKPAKAVENAKDNVVEDARDAVPDVSDLKPKPRDGDDGKGLLPKNKH